MPSTEALEAAGRRAALGPVPNPPSLDTLVAEVDRRRSRRRRIVGGVAAALVAAVAIPSAAFLVDDGRADVVTLASEDGDESLTSDAGSVIPEALSSEAGSTEPASATPQAEPAETSAPTTVADAATDDAVSATPSEDSIDGGPLAGLSDENFDLRLDLGDESFAIVVLHGDEALSRADDAATAADETRQIDGQTVWLDERDDELAVSALFEGETFVQVTGPRDQIERILDLVTQYAEGPLRFFDLEGLGEQFDLPEGFLDGEGLFDENSPFADGDLPFLEDGALDDFRGEMEEFGECMDITIDRSGSTTTVEIPDCELPTFDGLFDDLLGDLPFDLEGLFDDLADDAVDSASS